METVQIGTGHGSGEIFWSGLD